jgi:hypothetical protein
VAWGRVFGDLGGGLVGESEVVGRNGPQGIDQGVFQSGGSGLIKMRRGWERKQRNRSFQARNIRYSQLSLRQSLCREHPIASQFREQLRSFGGSELTWNRDSENLAKASINWQWEIGLNGWFL